MLYLAFLEWTNEIQSADVFWANRKCLSLERNNSNFKKEKLISID